MEGPVLLGMHGLMEFRVEGLMLRAFRFGPSRLGPSRDVCRVIMESVGT